jgi:hypothetical protein
MTPTWLSGLNWYEALELLSLDFTAPIYPELGVGITCAETLRGVIRDTLLGRLNGSEAKCVGSPAELALFYSSHVQALLTVLERALGPSSRARLEYWTSYVACSEDHNPWCPYEEMFQAWASEMRRTGNDSITFSLSPALILLKFDQITNIDETRKILANQRHRFLTDWDLPLFRDRGLLDLPVDSEFFPFVDQAVLAIAMNRFQTFWSWLRAAITDTDILRIDALMQARGRGSPVHPRELPVLITT